MKNTDTKTEGIYTITGKRWTKAGHDRMYITIDIEKDGHSYKELSKAAVGCLCGGDWWIDMTTGDVMHKEIPSKVSSWHVTAIEKLCAEMYTDLVADAQEAIVEPKSIMMTEEMAEDMGDMVAWDRAQMDTADDVYEGGSTVGMSYADLMVTYDVMDLVADAQEAPKSRIIKSIDDLESWDIDNLKIMIHRWIMDTDYATDEDDSKRWDLTLIILKDLIKAGVYDMCAPKAGKNFIKDLIKKYTEYQKDRQNCEKVCENFWLSHTKDLHDELTFISTEAGYVGVIFTEFCDEVFTYISEYPQKDIMQYIKRTYTVA